jgi:hypothetical protein
LKVIQIFDLLGIDLVFGLPLTEEGFHGCLIITEYITKFPWVVPITSKEAIEIARHIFHYICIFGPPKGLLSDEGNEFCNLLVNTMLELFGIKHIITSPYHPQTNGLTKKFNGILIKMLRTHAEENPTNWHLYIDLVVMAYRKRIHSSTGFAPYTLIFGKEMNDFDTSDDTTLDLEAQLQQRNSEIQILLDHTRPSALKNIDKSQKQQIINQNNSNNVDEIPLEPNSQVMVKSLKLVKPKLAPKYSGPFTVESRTPLGNYYLRDRTKKLLSQAMPRSRLKALKENIDINPYYDVEKILNDRIRNGNKEYLVKWKSYPDSENNWIPEQDFQNIQCLEDYNAIKLTDKSKQINSIQSNSSINNIIPL